MTSVIVPELAARTSVFADRDAWLAGRLGGYGGTDAVTIAGVNPHQTKLGLYAERRGLVEPVFSGDAEAADMGNRLEPVVLAKFGDDSGLSVLHTPLTIVRHSSDRLVRFSPDGAVRSPETLEYRGPAQIKTTSQWKLGTWRDGVPLPVLVQVNWEMLAAEVEEAWVAVLIGGQRFLWARVERHDRLIGNLLRLVGEFDDRVRNGDAPDTTEADKDVLAAIYPKHREGVRISLPDEYLTLTDEYQALYDERERIEERIREIKNQIRARIGDAEAGELPDGSGAWTNRAQTRKAYTKTVAEKTHRVLRLSRRDDD